MMMRSFLAVLTLIGTIHPALAQPAEGDVVVHREVAVRYGDLNLKDERDVAILLDRIGRAAEQACGGRPASLYELDDSYLRQQYHRCHSDAVARAVAKVNVPEVTQQLALAE